MLISPDELRDPAQSCAKLLEALLTRIADAPDAEAHAGMSNLESWLRTGSPLCPPLIAALPARAPAGDILAAIDPLQLANFRYDWPMWARPAQIPPETNWRTFLARSGRGSGKTRLASEWIRKRKNFCPVLAIIADNAHDFRETVVKGESGVLQCSPPWDRPVYKKTDRTLEWRNGARAIFYSAEEPDSLRGPNNAAAWVDELAKFKYAPEVWQQLALTMRAAPRDGKPPQVVVTTTPRPIPLLKSIQADPTTILTVESTFANSANLAPEFISAIQSMSSTANARQEIYGDLLDEAAGALWNRAMIEANRVTQDPGEGFWKKTYIGLDPAAGKDRDETGIVVVSLGTDSHAYVRCDASGRLSPNEWGRRVAQLWEEYDADMVIAEGNQGGLMVSHVLESINPHLVVRMVHASVGKQARADPVVARYERGFIHHVGSFPALEDQLCEWEPDSGKASPDRLDALVWAVHKLMIKPHAQQRSAGGPIAIPISEAAALPDY